MERDALQPQTSTNVNRDSDMEERLSQLIYQNETLEIEVRRLRGILESTGALKVHELQSLNETQHQTITHLKAQLEEKEQQLTELRSANTRFANIDATVQNFLTQLQEQQQAMEQLKRALAQKEANEGALQAQLEQLRTSTAAAGATAWETQAQTLETTTTELRRELQHATQQLAERTRAHEAAVTQLTAEKQKLETTARQTATQLSAAREAAATAQQQLAALQAQAHTPPRMAGTAATPTSDGGALTPHTESYVQRRVAEATAGLEQRLREQTELNASLLAFKAMVQNEKEVAAAGKTPAVSPSAAPTATGPVVSSGEREQLRNRQQEAYQEMQKRVSRVLAADKLSKKDIQLLLQEMLDYQEVTDEDTRTRLLIKDIQAEELAKLHEQTVKRLENENASLLKQLRDALRSNQAAVGHPTTTTLAAVSPRVTHAPSHSAAPVVDWSAPTAAASTTATPSTSEWTTGVPRDTAWLQPRPRHVDTALGTQPYTPATAAKPDVATGADAFANLAMVQCPGCRYWQRNDHATCLMCGRILPRR